MSLEERLLKPRKRALKIRVPVPEVSLESVFPDDEFRNEEVETFGDGIDLELIIRHLTNDDLTILILDLLGFSHDEAIKILGLQKRKYFKMRKHLRNNYREIAARNN